MPTYIVYTSDLDAEAAQLVALKKGFTLLPTAGTADPAVYDALRDGNSIVCIGGHFANPYSRYYFPNLGVDANGLLVGESGISANGRYIVSTRTRANGTTVTIVAGLYAADTLAAAQAFCIPVINQNTLLLIGGVALAGIAGYFFLKKKK
jgi:LPXTG-motif cell wall-anchored protein